MENTIRVRTTRQRLTFMGRAVVAADAVATVGLDVLYDETWDAKTRWARFFRDEQVFDVRIKGNTCTVPNEVLVDEGSFELALFAEKDGRRITTNRVTVTVERSVDYDDDPPATPTLLEQVTALHDETETFRDEAGASATAAAESAESASERASDAEAAEGRAQEAADAATVSAAAAKTSEENAAKSAQEAKDAASSVKSLEWGNVTGKPFETVGTSDAPVSLTIEDGSLGVSAKDATSTEGGLMTAADKAKLDSVESGATKVDKRTLDKLAQELTYDQQVRSGTYPGRDLAVILADEIGEGETVYDAIYNRTVSGNYDGMRVGDYIDVEISDPDGAATKSGTVRFLIAQFDPDSLSVDESGVWYHSVAFVSEKQVYAITKGKGETHWNRTNTNNGTSDQPCPYLASWLHEWETAYASVLPTALGNRIVERYVNLEKRYSSDGALSDPTDHSYVSIGKVWSLSETEVSGQVTFGKLGYSDLGDQQFELFRDRKRWEAASYDCVYQGRATPLRSVASGSAENALFVWMDEGRCILPKPAYFAYFPNGPRPCFVIGKDINEQS